MADGTWLGRVELLLGGVPFAGGGGMATKDGGTWALQSLAQDQFRLTCYYENGTTWYGTFHIVDRNHIHCVDLNYDAVRVVPQ